MKMACSGHTDQAVLKGHFKTLPFRRPILRASHELASVSFSYYREAGGELERTTKRRASGEGSAGYGREQRPGEGHGHRARWSRGGRRAGREKPGGTRGRKGTSLDDGRRTDVGSAPGPGPRERRDTGGRPNRGGFRTHRRAGQRRRHRRTRPGRRAGRRGLEQDALREPEGALPALQSGLPTYARGGRRHHRQHLLGGGKEGLGERVGLLRLQVRSHRLNRNPRRRREGAWHKSDRALPGSDGHQLGSLLTRGASGGG